VSTSSTSAATKSRSAAAKKPAADKPRPFEVRRSRIQGRGVFATAQIRKGKKLIEYVGEPITPEEADRRYDDANGRHHTFLFVLNDTTVLDARRGGNDARFINHSCEPNCETVIDNDRIWIRSITPIAPETELVYDYRFDWDDAYEPDDVRYYACRCGGAKCRGTILRVPVYLRKTAREWLTGNDVPKPRKPRKKSAEKEVLKKGAEKAAKKALKKAAKKGAAT
jgi:SET domain-containing protein